MNFLASFLQSLKPRYDDDVIDRLNYYYTCIIILILSITISAKQYVGQPIQCWVPAQFTGAWEQYAENYCFVQNTYWTPIKEPIPSDLDRRSDQEIGYYQWVPFILAIEALLFYLPCVIWRALNFQSEMSVETCVKMAADVDNIHTDNREKAVKTVSKHIEDALTLQYGLNQTASVSQQMLHCGKTNGIYVTSAYLLVKAMYVFNVIGQFFLLNAFLGPKSYFWGVEILSDLYNGWQWEESGHFPRVTLCDFEVRVLGNNHRYTIQCVLMINMFNEKIFLFLWWWFLLVIIANICSFVYWLYIMCSYERKEAFVNRYLVVSAETGLSGRGGENLYKFVHYGLRPDGVFLMRLLAANAGEIITTEVIAELWAIYVEKLHTSAMYRANRTNGNHKSTHPNKQKHYYGNVNSQSISRPFDPSSKMLLEMQEPPGPDGNGFMESVYHHPSANAGETHKESRSGYSDSAASAPALV